MAKPGDIPLFLKERKIARVIAFSGGAPSIPKTLSATVRDAREKADELFQGSVISDCLNRLRPYNNRIAILTGGTKWSVPATASRIAKKLGFSTIGIFPARATRQALGNDILDLAVCVDKQEGLPNVGVEYSHKFQSEWGDESAWFSATLDGVVVFGGGAGTLVEIAHILKANESLVDKKRTPKFIVPVTSSGGTADTVPYLPAKPQVRAASMPLSCVVCGSEAAELLEERLNLFDLYDEDDAVSSMLQLATKELEDEPR